jgi:tetratricopeptide (TPR) repeat protein
VQPSPVPGSNQPSFPSEQARAESAIAEFQKVADKYSGQPRDIARYFIAAQRLSIPQERQKGLDELKALTESSYKDVAAQARFALAQAREADGQMDEAVGLYNQLIQDNSGLIPADTVSLRIASIYEKQGKTKEAVELLFKIAENARKAKSPEGKPLPKSSAAREAETKLQKLDAARFAQLPPEAPSDLPLS